MFGKTEVQCPVCNRREMVDTEELQNHGIGCCNTTMQPTSAEEYDDEYARFANKRAGG